VVKNCPSSLGCGCKNDFAKEKGRETSVQRREPLNPVTRYPLPVTRYPLPVTRYPLPVTRYPLPVTRYPLPVTHAVNDFTSFLPVSFIYSQKENT
jgi:hypothetical protein